MVATIINGDERITLPEDIRRALDLEDGAVVLVEHSGPDRIIRPANAESGRSAPAVASTRSSDEAIQNMESVFGSLRRYAAGPILTDDDWDEAIAQAIVEDFLDEDYGDESGDRR